MRHGGNISEFANICKCSENDVVDFSSNINPITPKYSLSGVNIASYAEPSYKKLTKKVSKTFELDSKHTALYNGTSSAIFAIFAYLKPKKTFLYAPLFSEYERASRIYSKNTLLSNRFEDLYEYPPKNSLVVFVNPSTPDGKYYDLHRLLKIWQQQKCKVLVDESFLPFSEQKSIRQSVKNSKNIFIIQSLTKIYGCAGIRIGAIFSHEKNIIDFKKIQAPWALSSLDASVMLDILSDSKHIKKSIKKLKKRKHQLEKILSSSKLFFKIFSTDANFILVKLHTLNAKVLQKKLLPYKILIRDCESFEFLDDTYVRFAVKDKHSHKKLKKALNEIT